MADVEERLRKIFGTSQIGDCKHCKFADKAIAKRGLACGQTKCPIKTKFDLLVGEESGDADTKKLLGKMSKMFMLGFTEHMSPPWILLEGQDKSWGWVNPSSKSHSNKLYKIIYTSGNFLIGVTEEVIINNEKRSRVDVFSALCKDKCLTDGLDNVVLKITRGRYAGLTPLWTMNNRNAFRQYNWMIDLDIIENKSGKVMDLLLTDTGGRVILPYSDPYDKTLRQDDAIIHFRDLKTSVKLDKDLGIMRGGTGIPIIRV